MTRTKKRPKNVYPHMPKEEAAIWDDFLTAVGELRGELTYDLGLGPGKPCHESATAEEAAYWKKLTCKRADVVEINKGQAMIYEVKLIADMKALGQCLTYIELLKRDRPELKSVYACVVCRTIDIDILPAYVPVGITIIKVKRVSGGEPVTEVVVP